MDDRNERQDRSDRYDFRAIEAKWQELWEEQKTFRARGDAPDKKLYVLEMFPYPSGAGLSVGHCKNYAPTDAFCRYQAMRGHNVLHPMGWDAFGQPAENEAIKRQRNPREMVPEYAGNYRRTLKRIGASYDWEREINSSLPAYYKWTQWFFLLLYRRGLAYRADAPINWCPKCQTGLANEEVKEGRCWRCDTPVEKRPMPQWYFRITAYADRLLAGLDTVNWPEGTKQMQREWIGRSEGAEVDFSVAGPPDPPTLGGTPTASSPQNWGAGGATSPQNWGAGGATSPQNWGAGGANSPQNWGAGGANSIRVFTTRPDTLFGATFMVLAPEHPLVSQITTPDRKAEVDAYVRRAQHESEIERTSTKGAKTGVFTGAYAVNPVNDERIPIWIADYVLMGYGTGAIMAVPAHDQRDFEFARKFGLPIRMVYRDQSGPATESEMTEALPHGGVMVNSAHFDGSPNSKETVHRFVEWLEQTGKGVGKVNYRLRDWLISRQRYWGAPIPIVHCANCGEVPVPEDQLPVVLPDVENYQPSGTGESPLATIPEFVNTDCPTCGGPAKRETDTMGGFACSSWYFLRFADPRNAEEFAARDKVDYWLPVDTYAGGAEHSVMHLLYARFWTKVMKDAGLVSFDEPFQTLRHQGSMLAYTPGRRPRGGEDVTSEEEDERVVDWIVLKPEERASFPDDQIVWRWARMSKSKGNVVTPDEMCEKYGADSLRLYIMFVAPFEDNVQWSEDGMNGAFRFANRVWRWLTAALPAYDAGWRDKPMGELDAPTRKVRRKLHQTIAKVGGDIEEFRFNTAVAALMELVNELYAWRPVEAGHGGGPGSPVLSEAVEALTPLIAPFMPHMADELWERLNKPGSTYDATWPAFDAAVAAEDEMTIPIQVNGKVRDKLTVRADTSDERLRELALASEKVVEALDGKQVRNVVVVPKRLVNVVIG